MTISVLPGGYSSAFRPACFSLAGVAAPGGVDIEISAPGRSEPLGVKRIYTDDTATVNVAPYARRLLSPEPLVALGAGVHAAAGRYAECFVSAPGLVSPVVPLCGGTEDSPVGVLLSAAPPAVRIAPGERDEMAVISEDWVRAVVTFRLGNVTYTDSSMGGRRAAGMVAAVVDADAVCRSFSLLTGLPSSGLAEFTVTLRLEQPGYANHVVERRYTFDGAARSGRRLAWLNRYGAVDYHTFAVWEEFRSGGSRVGVSGPAGYRTVATRAASSLRLSSGPCDVATAAWLAEIFSSPAVWTVDGAAWERVEVAPGEAVCSPLAPCAVQVTVRAAEPQVSRKL